MGRIFGKVSEHRTDLGSFSWDKSASYGLENVYILPVHSVVTLIFLKEQAYQEFIFVGDQS
jgi:hypothetical protein